MSDKLKIRITCSERVRYDQTVEMTREEWLKLKATPERKMEDGDMSPLTSWLDLREVLSGDDFDDIEIDVVGDDNKPVKPSDCYDGGEDV
jgi:hypothetical protein